MKHIAHIPYKYIHNEDTIRITNWQEFTKQKLRMPKR